MWGRRESSAYPDDRILNKETLLTGWGGYDHDHGVHAVVFGPDGRYYWNSGDQGFDVTDRSGNRFMSSPKGPHFAGTALRVNPDGTEFTVLGHNFRNPFELAVDSFGTVWQTDNDDDGNQWTRVNYVMEGGNFGYWGPGGRKWREDKGSHFHSELPGVVPNIARTGPGAPTGLVVYEGSLLPDRYRGQLIHSEAGKRVINTFYLADEGAGYSLNVENTVSSTDPNFRPSDIVVAPDGSLYFCDWYDPVVGGHNMDDVEKGRIYRLAPRGFKPRKPEVDLESPEGLAATFRSPAQSIRYLAYSKLHEQGRKALPHLLAMWKGDDSVLQARALWLLGGLGEDGQQAVREALEHPNRNLRTLGIRVARRHGADIIELTRSLFDDPSPQVRREIALGLQHVVDERALDPWIELAKQYDGEDRWYLEAMAIGARGKENALYPKLRDAFPGAWDAKLGKLLWVLRPSDALPYLISSINSRRLNSEQRLEALTALSAMSSPEATVAVAGMVRAGSRDTKLAENALERLSKQLFSEWIGMRARPEIAVAIKHALRTPDLQTLAVDLTADLADPRYGPSLLVLAQSSQTPKDVRAAAVEALGATKQGLYLPVLEKLAVDAPAPVRVAAIRGLGALRPDGLEAKLQGWILADAPNEVHSEALRVLARTDSGLSAVLDLEETQGLPDEIRTLATYLAHSSPDPVIKARAEKILPPLASKTAKIAEPGKLFYQIGDTERGREVFLAKDGPRCSTCHALEPGEQSTGPNLAAIGGKLGKQALLDSILSPSAGIAQEYRSWVLETKTQGVVIGILKVATPQRVVVATETGDEIRLDPSEITSPPRKQAFHHA